MAAYFFDSSALVKRYVSEIGSSWVIGLTAPRSGNRVYIAGITSVEVVSALTRKQRGGHLSPPDAAAAIARFEHDLATDLRVFDLTQTVLATAMALAKTYGLRGYDAVQLAVALAIEQERAKYGFLPLTLIASDSALLTAAAREGLPIDDPNLY